MSLQKKIILAFFTFIIIPLLILGTIASSIFSKLTQNQYSEQSELTLNSLLLNIEQVFKQMNRVTDSTIASRAIQEALSNLNTGDIGNINYLELNEIQQSLRELLVNHPSISYAFMYTLDKEGVHKLFSKASFTPLTFDEFKQLDIYHSVIQRDGLPLWIGPYEQTELTGKDEVFTLVRVVKDIDTLNNKGILLVQIHHSDIEAIFRYFRYKDQHTNYLIVNEQGLIIYDSNRLLKQQNLQQLTTWTSNGNSYESQRVSFNGVDSVLSTISFGNYEQWQLISVTPWSVIAGEINWVTTIIFVSIALCLGLACIFILFFTQKITHSIIETVKVMGEVERGNLQARVRVRGNDESGLLTRGFNRLVHRLDELIAEMKKQSERKRAAEIAVLQAQIKPHFLFNALESINILAIQNQGKKVSQMVSKLGNILRISIQQQEEITLDQELEHVRSYLDIQKYRFEHLFDYEISVADDTLLQAKTLKLSLQPLVENAIQHGFEGIEYLGVIRILITSDDDCIHIQVIDNGHGISNEQLAKFKYLANKQDHFINHPEVGERRGIGVSNVADRIRLQYGEPYGIFICSTIGSGTIVKLTIPKRKDGAGDETKGFTH